MTATTTSQALEKKAEGPGALVEQYRADFALVLPTHIKPEQWVRVAQGLLRRDKALFRVANSNPGSFLSAMLRCAHLGLEPGDTFHLVAFGNEVVGITDYTGEIELIYRAGEVASIKAEVVYSKDRFEYDPGEMDRPIHKADWFSDRGEMVGVYAYAVMKTGAVSRVVVMNKAEVEKVKAVSKTAKQSSSPWNQWPDRMWLKTVVKQLAKWVPSSAEYREHLLRSQSALLDVSPELQSELPEPLPSTHEDDDIIDAEIVDGEKEPAPAAPPPPPPDDEDLPAAAKTDEWAKVAKALKAQAMKAFPLEDLAPKDRGARRDLLRHAVAFCELGEHISAADQSIAQMRRVESRLASVEAGDIAVAIDDTAKTVSVTPKEQAPIVVAFGQIGAE